MLFKRVIGGGCGSVDDDDDDADDDDGGGVVRQSGSIDRTLSGGVTVSSGFQAARDSRGWQRDRTRTTTTTTATRRRNAAVAHSAQYAYLQFARSTARSSACTPKYVCTSCNVRRAA